MELPPGLCPPPIEVEFARDGDAHAPLLGEEAACAARMVASRRAEFAAGRAAARRALARLGVAPVPIVPGARREPRWPPGVVGSIAHCRGACLAAVAPAIVLDGLGIDLEPVAELEADVARLVVRPDEPGQDGTALEYFVAKEAVFKAQFPLARAELEFQDVRLRLAPDGTFRASTAHPAAAAVLGRLQGRLAVREGFVIASAIIPAGETGARTDAVR